MKLGLTLASSKDELGRVYHIVEAGAERRSPRQRRLAGSRSRRNSEEQIEHLGWPE